MKLQAARKELSYVASLLRDSGIDFIVYGSVGVAFYLGAFKGDFKDIDLLIPGQYLNSGWSQFMTFLEGRGYRLVDEWEHEFDNGRIKVAFAEQNILIRDGIVECMEKSISQPFGDDRLITLTPEVFLRVYEYSNKDGYRINTRKKKDREVIERLRNHLP